MASVKDVENHSLPPVDVHFLNDRRWRTDHRNSESTASLQKANNGSCVTQQLRNRQHDDGFPLTDPDLLANQFASSGPGITYTNDLPCNSWNETKLNLAPLLYTATYVSIINLICVVLRVLSSLDMQLPLTGDISIRSNATLDETPATKLSGNLLVEYDPNLNSDSAFISVSLHTSTLALREATRVCYSYDGPDRGISIFVRLSLLT